MLRIKDDSGVALMYVIVVMTVVFLLIAGIITVSMSENAQVIYQSNEVTAYYVARAGAESMVGEMKRMNKTKYVQFASPQKAIASNIIDIDGDGNGDIGDVEVTVTYDGSQYVITSVGTYEGHSETVRLRMSYQIQNEMSYAAYAQNDMGDSSPSGEISIKSIKGGLGSGGDIYVKDADIGKAVPADEVIPNYEYDIDILTVNPYSITFDDTMNNPPDNAPLDISVSTQISHLDFKKAIRIDTTQADHDKASTQDYDTYFNMDEYGNGSGDWLVFYLPDKAIITSGIEVNGDKNLMIIVGDSLYLDGGITINDSDGDGNYPYVEIHVVDESDDTNGDVSSKNANSNGDYDLVIKGSNTFGLVDEADHLIVYLYGEMDENEVIVKNNKMAMNNNSDFYGYIFGPEATIDLKNGNTYIYGGVYASEINFEASVSVENPNETLSSNVTLKTMGIDYWE